MGPVNQRENRSSRRRWHVRCASAALSVHTSDHSSGALLLIYRHQCGSEPANTAHIFNVASRGLIRNHLPLHLVPEPKPSYLRHCHPHVPPSPPPDSAG